MKSPAVDERTTKQLARLLASRVGLRLEGAGQATDSVLQRAAERAGASSVASYAADLVVGNASLTPLIEETRIGETYFFREPHQLAFLKRQVFDPHAAAMTRAPLRLWSAGCASGEEAYTLAMLAEDALVPTEILGTDLSEVALEVARRAEYAKWSLRGPEKYRAQQHLHRVANGAQQAHESWVVDDRTRARVKFAPHNLVGSPPPRSSAGGWNAILCRNVLIYFDQETQTRVIGVLAGALAEDGWLLLGSCDPPAAQASSLLEAVVAEEGVFYRRRSSVTTSPRPSFAPTSPPTRGDTTPPVTLPPSSQERRRRRAELLAAHRRETMTGPPPPPPPPSILVPPVPVAAKKDDDAHAACRHGLEALELGDRGMAFTFFRRALYLDPDLVVAELASAALLEREGDAPAAARGYRRALRIAETRGVDDEVPLASGATYGDISAHCRRMLVSLENERRHEERGP